MLLFLKVRNNKFILVHSKFLLSTKIFFFIISKIKKSVNHSYPCLYLWLPPSDLATQQVRMIHAYTA